MDAKPPLRKALELEPLDFPTPPGDAERKESDESAPDGQAQRDPRVPTGDVFLARAEKEYQEGHIDPALWRLAAAQGANDESVVVAAYLRARAKVLQLQQKRATVPPAAGRTARPIAGAGERKVVSAPPPAVASTNQAGTRGRGMRPKLKYLAAMGAAALAVVAAVVWMFASESGSVRQPVVSAAPSSPNQTASPAPSGSVQGDTAGASQRDLRPAFETEIRDLKQAGNWNVVVLYASNWTRKEPNNASAWYELSVAYAKMRQLDDAFHAATQAAQLAPKDGSLWNNLGQVNLSLERLPEANAAFDKALGLRGDDPDALCGAALVAQRQGRRSDADALAGRIKSAAGCGGVTTAAVAR
jgi:tetratricopeptide (TPR) repeat protein